MPATQQVLSRWFDEGLSLGASHMIVKCDDFDYRGNEDDQCCYPVYVSPGQDVRKIDHENTDRTMEVYSFAIPKDEQIRAAGRVFNYD